MQIEAECVSSCSWVWRRHCQPTLLSSQLCGSGAEQAKERQVAAAVLQPSQAELNDFPIVGNSLVYWPSSTDCGRRLLLECIPTDTGGRVGAPVFLLTSEVSPSPSSVTPITRRHKLTPSHLTSPDRFRVVSYNILADPYASTNFARQVLYPYCYPDALDIEYRQCLVVRELLGYHADVMCLQEVGEKSYTRFLLPALQDEGYEGCFSTKAGRVSLVHLVHMHGVATVGVSCVLAMWRWGVEPKSGIYMYSLSLISRPGNEGSIASFIVSLHHYFLNVCCKYQVHL